jgi:hypothetical protein
MAGEARSMWEAFITAPENAHLLKRYAKSAKEPAPLFEHIGEDLGSSNQEIREIAFWALVYAMPKLTSILHERETRQPGWRDVEGKDQKMINRGVDIVSYLHRKLVVENRFKIRGGRGKDPRPLMNKIARNWQEDEQRKRRREAPLDDEDDLEIPDSAPSLEDSLLEKIAYEERKRELRNWGFYSNEDELALLETVYVDEIPFAEVAKSRGVTSEEALLKLTAALRQQASRSRKQAVAERDKQFTTLLILNPEFPLFGTYPTYLDYWSCIKRAEKSIQPRAWLNGVVADGKNALAVRSLTTGFRGAPAHLYLIALHRDYPYKEERLKTLPGDSYYFPRIDPQSLDRCVKRTDQIVQRLRGVAKLIDPTSKGYTPNLYPYYQLTAYPTALPGINAAIAEVRDAYDTWLISNVGGSRHWDHWDQ